MKNELIDIITDYRWMHTLVITFILLSPIVLMGMAPVASPFIAGAVVNEHTNGEVALAYEFLTQVVGLSDVNSRVKNVSQLTVPDIGGFGGWNYEKVDMHLVDNSLLSMLVTVGENELNLDDVVQYSVWTEDIEEESASKCIATKTSLEIFLQRLIKISVSYCSAYTRALEVMEQTGVYVGARALYEDILYTVSCDEDRLVLRWSRVADGIPSFYENYWVANSIEISVDSKMRVVSFGNTWDKYGTGSTQIVINENEALNMALSSLEEDKLDAVGDINAELVYYRGDGRNPSLLYPCWWTRITYDKTFPNDVTQHLTLIWADNGIVWYNSDQGYYTTSSTTASSYGLPEDERESGVDITEYIHEHLSDKNIADYYYPTVYKEEMLSSAEQNLVFHIGHGGRTWEEEFHFYMEASDGEKVYDNEIYYNSTSAANFVLLWSCYQGYSLGGNYSSGNPFGMPFAYSHRTDLSEDGYYSPDNRGFAFIGFKWLAPFLTNEIGGVRRAGFFFLKSFYRALIDDSTSINQALDLASNSVWGVNWVDSYLYRFFEMRIYGNGRILILYSHLHLVTDIQNMYGSHQITSSIQESLEKIGINVVIEYRNTTEIADTVWGDYWDKTWDKEPGLGWDMTWYEFCGTPEDLMSYYLGNVTPPDGYNIMCWNNDRADTLLTYGMQATDAAERKYYLWKWQEEFMHDPPCIILYYPSETICARGLAFNLHHPALSNRYVRQAIAHAIKYQEILTEILPDWDIEAYQGKAPIHPSIKYTDPNNVTVNLFNQELAPYTYDINKAKQYLDMWHFAKVGTDYTLGPVGDADFSGRVDYDDYWVWWKNFNTTSADWTFTPGNDIDPDFDNNDFVDMDDYDLWHENYGEQYPFYGAR